MALPDTLAAVLDRVAAAQAVIDEQTQQIGDLLDQALLQDGSFDHLSTETLESLIRALPDSCFYRVTLKKAWRDRTRAATPVQ